MKNTINIITAFSAALISFSASAQKIKGEGVISAGTSLSVFAPGASINAVYDYSFADKFSIGLGGNYTHFNSDYINLTRTNIGVRGLFHIWDNLNWDVY